MVPAPAAAPPPTTGAPPPGPAPAPPGAYPGAPYPYPPYYYAPLPPPPPPPPRRHGTGFLALPYIGINSFGGDNAGNIDTGLRIGTFLGGRISDVVSLNGELTFDLMNPEVPADTHVTETMAHVTLSPLFHVDAGSLELVIGPKFGFWSLRADVSSTDLSGNLDQRGWTLGVNAGLFFPVGGGPTELGLLFSYATLEITHACATLTYYGSTIHECPDPSGDANVVSLAGAALF
jgi:hypothetical protein